MKKRLMIFCDAYLPGYRGGGGMWAVRNLAERFCDRYDFFIVTRDCDGKVDDTPYVRTARNTWTTRAEAQVYYASPSNIRITTFAELVEAVKPDAIYLNSVFSKVCVTFLLSRKRFLKTTIPLMVAPCGEMSDTALNVRRIRKRIFLSFAKNLGLLRKITWKAASEAERSDIYELVSTDACVKIAPELTPKDILPGFDVIHKPQKCVGTGRFIFFSRIAPIKNLHFLLELFHEANGGTFELNVIGPVEDSDYLEKCQRLAETLPPNVTVRFLGTVDNATALDMAKNSHFMVLPTKYDSFGYVVIESLAAGCPVLISDQMEWSGIRENNVGWKIPLDDRNAWLSQLNVCVSMGSDEYHSMSLAAREFAVRYLVADEPTAVNQVMFDTVLTAQNT